LASAARFANEVEFPADAYAKEFPDLAKQLDLMLKRELPEGWVRICRFSGGRQRDAGRDASGKALNVLAQNVPWLMGGGGGLGAFDEDAADSRRSGRLPNR